MATAVNERDLRRVLDVVDAAGPPATAGGAVPTGVLQALAALVPADIVGVCELEPETATTYLDQDWDGEHASLCDQPATEPTHPFWVHYDASLFCSYPTRTGDHRSITLRSDFYSTTEWRSTAMYDEGLAQEYELMCCLPPAGPRWRKFMFFRSASDFDERDRMVMALLRPHLAELLAPGRTPAPVLLTPRQTELMRLVAAGWSNAEIASSLFVSPHTVRKHLENIFERLEVTTRTAAVARAFPA